MFLPSNRRNRLDHLILCSPAARFSAMDSCEITIILFVFHGCFLHFNEFVKNTRDETNNKQKYINTNHTLSLMTIAITVLLAVSALPMVKSQPVNT